MNEEKKYDYELKAENAEIIEKLLSESGKIDSIYDFVLFYLYLKEFKEEIVFEQKFGEIVYDYYHRKTEVSKLERCLLKLYENHSICSGKDKKMIGEIEYNADLVRIEDWGIATVNYKLRKSIL
jgi:hypothetical protein